MLIRGGIAGNGRTGRKGACFVYQVGWIVRKREKMAKIARIDSSCFGRFVVWFTQKYKKKIKNILSFTLNIILL